CRFPAPPKFAYNCCIQESIHGTSSQKSRSISNSTKGRRRRYGPSLLGPRWRAEFPGSPEILAGSFQLGFFPGRSAAAFPTFPPASHQDLRFFRGEPRGPKNFHGSLFLHGVRPRSRNGFHAWEHPSFRLGELLFPSRARPALPPFPKYPASGFEAFQRPVGNG